MIGNDHNQAAARYLVRSILTLSVILAALCAPAAFALDSGDIVVSSVKGEVHVTMNGADQPVRSGSVLELPATVRTGADGSLELRQGATTVAVGPDTQLDFPALEKRGGSIDRIVQPRGSAFYNIGKRPGHRLRIETPYLVGVVKGTQFNVVAQENATTISLFEGLLEVRSIDDSDVIDLHAGEIASRSRADIDINVLKMGGDKPPSPPRAPAGAQTSGDATPAPLPTHPAASPGDATDAGSLFVVRDSPDVRPLFIAPPTGVEPLAAVVAAPAAPLDLGTSTNVNLGAVETGGAAANNVVTAPLSGVSVVVPPSVDVNSVVNAVPVSAAAEVAVAVSPVAPVPVPVSLDVNASVGNVDLGVSVGVGGVTTLLNDDNQGNNGNSGQGSNGNSGQGNNGNSGQGNNGNGQGNDGTGPGNNGQGNNDKGTVVDDVQDLLGTLRGKSGKK